MAAKQGIRRKRVQGARGRTGEVGDTWESLFHSLGRIEVVLLVGAVLLMLVLIYTIQDILSPFLLLGAILFLLYPMRGYTVAKNVMWLSITLFAIWFVYTISPILAPFVISLIVAYILNPIVERFEKWNVPRWVTSLVLILIFLALITLILFFVLPVAVTQFEGVLDAFSQLVSDFNNWMWNARVMHSLERYGISAEELKNTLTSHFAPKLEDISKSLLKAVLALATSVSRLVTQVFYVILMPFLTFYILTDFPKIAHRFRMLFPQRHRQRVSDYLDLADEVIGLYLRGALTVAFLQGVLVALLFSLFGIKYALVLGILAAILDLVPYFGLLIIMILSALVAAFSDPPTLPKVVFAISSVGILHLLEATYLSPRIIGEKVGMHPLLIILSLLVFSYFLGFVGLVIAVPTSALIILLIREWEAKKHGVSLREYHSTSVSA